MPTSARPHPSLNAMLLCDLTIREHGTGKMSLIGIFENISAARFPVVHRALTVYAKLADAEGDYGIRLELVRQSQAEEFYRALCERHVPVEYVTYPREEHGFIEPRHLKDRWQRYLVFFGKYLGNPPVTEPKEVVERMQKDLP